MGLLLLTVLLTHLLTLLIKPLNWLPDIVVWRMFRVTNLLLFLFLVDNLPHLIVLWLQLLLLRLQLWMLLWLLLLNILHLLNSHDLLWNTILRRQYYNRLLQCLLIGHRHSLLHLLMIIYLISDNLILTHIVPGLRLILMSLNGCWNLLWLNHLMLLNLNDLLLLRLHLLLLNRLV